MGYHSVSITLRNTEGVQQHVRTAHTQRVCSQVSVEDSPDEEPKPHEAGVRETPYR